MVAPLRTAHIQPEVEGVVAKVYVREGDVVRRGTILADLQDWRYRGELASAEAKYNTALSEMNRALASNNGTEAGIQRAQSDFFASEVTRARERLERAHLRAPIDGVVVGENLENLVGQNLVVGQKLMDVIDSSHAQVEVAVDEKELTLLQAGNKASVKLESFPTRTFSGTLVLVSPTTVPEAERRVFHAKLDVANSEGLIRSGMQGWGKISVGWHPAGYVFFRDEGIWFWSKMWSMFG